jgi:hypothetical protein
MTIKIYICSHERVLFCLLVTMMRSKPLTIGTLILGLIWTIRCHFALVPRMEREVTMGGVVEVTPIASQQSASRVPMMLVKKGQQDSRLWRGWSWGLVVLLRV